jgi:uncharacterized sporulation protein YeaH/YhbH (DUF444 family)
VALPIHTDLERFRRIVHGRVREDLKRYMASGEIIGKQGDTRVSIPLPEIRIPRLRYGQNQAGGIGSGDGNGGDKVDVGEGGAGPAGDAPADHLLEAELSLEELAAILGEELRLPRIEPRGRKLLTATRDRYTGIARVGPRTLRHAKRTFHQALKRQIVSGTYEAERPLLVPEREDFRYRTWQAKAEPQSTAAILYLMDVSGSMGREQKEIVRLEAFWIDTWLRSNYAHLERRFIIHDAVAREVDRDTFFRTRESGGTLISSAYSLAERIIADCYPAQEWNLYLFQFSDGDNWSAADTRACLDLLRRRLLPHLNLFCYGQVESEYGSGQFYNDLKSEVAADERVVLSRIPDREAIMASIRDFLGKGR